MSRARVALVAAAFFLSLSTVASAQGVVLSFSRLTFTGWNGIHLGDSVRAVARQHGWRVYDPGCRVISTGPARVQLAGDYDHPGRVRTISVWRKDITGPRGLAVGVRVADLGRLLHGVTRHSYSSGGDGPWYYWLVPADPGYLWVRADDRRTVSTFGLARSRANAVDRSTTMGGCF